MRAVDETGVVVLARADPCKGGHIGVDAVVRMQDHGLAVQLAPCGGKLVHARVGAANTVEVNQNIAGVPPLNDSLL